MADSMTVPRKAGQGRVSPVAELLGRPDSVLPEAIAARGGRTATGT